MANNEEKALKDRLSKLEKKYKESVFTKPKVPEVANNFEKNSFPDVGGEMSEPGLREKDLSFNDMNMSDKVEIKPIIESPSRRLSFEEGGNTSKKLKNSSFEEGGNSFRKLKVPMGKPMKKPVRNIIQKPAGGEVLDNSLPKKLKNKPIFSKPLFRLNDKNIKNDVKQVFEEKVARPSEQEIGNALNDINKMRKEVSKTIIGQEEIVDGLIMGLLCNAHVIVEGVPGIAKTLAIKTLAKVSGCDVKRVQFTVDMLPTDIIGITSYTPQKGFEVIKGPIFTNFLIADEINRSPPKTQSALIEGMQERQVTIGKKTFMLPNPFFVMASINPIENAGVYPLPEAQIDRFLFKLIMGYPKKEEEKRIMSSNITLMDFEDFNLKPVVTPKKILNMQEIVKKVYMDDNVKSYILDIVAKTRDKDFEGAEYITYGSSPRASIGIFIASKAKALMQGRGYVLPEDVKEVVFSVLRHRLILSYKTTIQKISADSIIQKILDSVRVS